MNISKNTLFLTELICNVFIFAVCAAACAGLLVRADAMTRESTSLTSAVYLAQTAAETGALGEYQAEETGEIAPDGRFTLRCTQEGGVRKIEVFEGGRLIYTLHAAERAVTG